MKRERTRAIWFKNPVSLDFINHITVHITHIRGVILRFRVTLFGRRDNEEVIEARDFSEASGIVKSRFPDHRGYSIEPVT
jgi:hypothetical protein